MQGFGLQNDTCSALLCSVIPVQKPESHLQEWDRASIGFWLRSTCCWLGVLRQNSAFCMLIFATNSTLTVLSTGDGS